MSWSHHSPLLYLSPCSFCWNYISIGILLSFSPTLSLCLQLFILLYHPCTISSFPFPFPLSLHLSSFAHDNLITPFSPLNRSLYTHAGHLRATIPTPSLLHLLYPFHHPYHNLRPYHHHHLHLSQPIPWSHVSKIISSNLTSFIWPPNTPCPSPLHHLVYHRHSNTQNGKLQCLLSLLLSLIISPGHWFLLHRIKTWSGAIGYFGSIDTPMVLLTSTRL